MTQSQAPLPPLGQVAAALRKTTETLARELSTPSQQAPPWDDFEWHIARAASAMQGISSLLYDTLPWSGTAAWRQFLQEQRRQSTARHARITQVLQVIDAQARLEGVPLIALKGAALNALGLYSAGERPMGDIDLLARHADLPAVARVLAASDYTATLSIHRHEIFEPRGTQGRARGKLGEHIDNPIKVEVHTRIAESLPVRETDITDLLWREPLHPGLERYPSNAALMLHLLLHAAGNIRARALRLIQLQDIALLASRFADSDWDELLAMRPNGASLWWALAPMQLVQRYFTVAAPARLLDVLSTDCPWWLRKRAGRQKLAEVSWSNIRIEAFPGLEWSRTPQEAFAFMRSRILPSRQARLELKAGADQIPDAASVPWYGLSHSARILRWVFSRPPRVQTLISVRAALAPEV
jgi:hypothetical protein